MAVSNDDRDFNAIVATVNAAPSYGEAAVALGLSIQRLSQLVRVARGRGFQVVDGRRPGRSRTSLGSRNAEIYRLFSDGQMPVDEIASRYKMCRDHIKKIVRAELRSRGLCAPGRPRRQLPRDRQEDRPLCPCGLSIDDDHKPETCDHRGGAARLAEKRLGHWSDTQGEDYHW